MGNSVASPFGCCLVKSKLPEADFLRTAANKVELAVSPLGGMLGFMAYHTSLLVNGEEFFFCQLGIMRNFGLESHRRPGEEAENFSQVIGGASSGGGEPRPELIDMGYSAKTGDMLYVSLCNHFRSGSYDLLHKNCNSFTDVALYFMVGRRLDSTYCSIEKVGLNNPRLLEQLTRGAYIPNELALDFNLEHVIHTFEEHAGAVDAISGERRLPVGTVAQIAGLKSQAAEGLNGKACVIHRYIHSTGRYEVGVRDELKALKPENLVPYYMNQEMVIHSLQSAAAKHLNGEVCRLLKYNMATERLEVKVVSTHEIKALKMEHVRGVDDSAS